MSSSAWTLFSNPVTTLIGLYCEGPCQVACVATSLVACPGSSIAGNCPGTDLLGGGGIGGDTAAILLGLKLYNSFPFLHQVYNAYRWKPSSHQPGWLEHM